MITQRLATEKIYVLKNANPLKYKKIVKGIERRRALRKYTSRLFTFCIPVFLFSKGIASHF